MSAEVAVASPMPSAKPGMGPKPAAARDGEEKAPAFDQLVGDDRKGGPATSRSADAEGRTGKAAGHWNPEGHGPWHLLDLAKVENARGEKLAADAKVDEAGEATEADALIAALAMVEKHGQPEVGRKAADRAVPDETSRAAPNLIATGKTRLTAEEQQARTSASTPVQRTDPEMAKAAPVLPEPDAPAADAARSPARIAATLRDDTVEPANPKPVLDQGAKVTVLSAQTSLAPATAAQGPLSATGQAFVQSLGSDEALPQHVREVQTVDVQPAAAKPVTSLKIQLHPAHLGTVTATISGAGEQLAIEVHVESHEAQHRLQTDSDQIVKALRGMGYDIDRITIQQAPQTGSTPGGATNRENAFAAPDQRAGGQQGQSWRQEPGQRYEDGHNPGGSGSDRGDVRGSGVYI